ncbi:hypothetical protein R1flu_015808 [Riccia fluitans]|uniref:Secreted protein n=1 Tax=Riccia fluitans TaxID=41844 RepID=A0ABD1YN30_9MARC
MYRPGLWTVVFTISDGRVVQRVTWWGGGLAPTTTTTVTTTATTTTTSSVHTSYPRRLFTGRGLFAWWRRVMAGMARLAGHVSGVRGRSQTKRGYGGSADALLALSPSRCSGGLILAHGRKPAFES